MNEVMKSLLSHRAIHALEAVTELGLPKEAVCFGEHYDQELQPLLPLPQARGEATSMS